MNTPLSFFRHSCWDVLKKMTDVLHINIFVVNKNGDFILPPNKTCYGGQLLTDLSLGFDISAIFPSILKKITPNTQSLEINENFGLRYYVIPVNQNTESGYILVGPVILNRRLENWQYQELALDRGIDPEQLWDQINDLRVVSNVMIKTILETLIEIIKNNFELSTRNNFFKVQEYLETFLNMIIKLTDAESGSLMLIDENKQQLIIRAIGGVQDNLLLGHKINFGEGIAGIAAQEGRSFTITKNQIDNRISHLLKRNDIKQSVVMPLVSQGQVKGILNIHTRNNESHLIDHTNNLTEISNILTKFLS